MPNESALPVPRLAPPGAGLPKVELFFARLIFRWHRLSSSREKSIALFARERRALLDLTSAAGADTCARRALIRRLPGLEDSSRDWSVFMTLDHLRIVNTQIAETIAELAQGRVPAATVSTAAVKPSPLVDANVMSAFAQSCDAVEQAAARVKDLRTAARRAHPWFGPLDASGWLAMAGFHQRLHRTQAEAILRAVTGTKTAA